MNPLIEYDSPAAHQFGWNALRTLGMEGIRTGRRPRLHLVDGDTSDPATADTGVTVLRVNGSRNVIGPVEEGRLSAFSAANTDKLNVATMTTMARRTIFRVTLCPSVLHRAM
jgi:hypothetical protein